MEKIPDEILRDIFRNSLPDIEMMREPHSLVSVTAPMDISHVCRRWRSVSLSFGVLWSFLSIYYDFEEDPHAEGWTHGVFFTWLERTNKSPLNFSIVCEPSRLRFLERACTEMEPLFLTLLSQQRRWRDVRCIFRSVEYAEMLRPKLRHIELNDMPLLESLEFLAIFASYDNKLVVPRIDIAKSPRLEWLKLGGEFVLERGDNPLRALRGVTLSVSVMHWRDSRTARFCLEILSANPDLVCLSVGWKLHVNCAYAPDTAMTDHTPLIHNIQELSFSTVRSPMIPISAFGPLIMERLTAPCLKVLNIENDQFSKSGPVLYNFIQRSLPPLVKLTASGGYTSQDTLLPTLRLLPSLKELILEGCRPQAWPYRELTLHEDKDVLCPGLKSVALKFFGTGEEDACEALYAMCTMIESRNTDSATVAVEQVLFFGEYRIEWPNGKIRELCDEMVKGSRSGKRGTRNIYVSF